MTTALEFHDLTVAYHTRPVLWDVDLSIPERKLVAIVGPNGAGKSTLIKAALDLLPLASGYVRVFGRHYEEVRRRVAYVPQRESVDWDFPATVLDVVLMGRYGRIGLGRRPKREDRDEAMSHLTLLSIPHLAQRPIGEVSGGEQQRVFIARALAMNPRLLILDEPTISLDACSQDELYDLMGHLKEDLKLTLILVSHDIGAVAAHVDDIVCLNRRVHVHQAPPIGRLALESTFGCSVEYLFHGEIPHRVVRVHDD
jgi:ABC-type Mn2+/Zn2+ transport system ATPase subunit